MQTMLHHHLLAFGRTFNGSDWIFIQDNALIHKFIITIQWFQDRNIQVMDWPPFSPNLNRMENLWGQVA